MTHLKPYLIRAVYEWLMDNNLTPYMLVDADNPDTILPMEFVEDGKIVLNVGGSAIQNLLLGNDLIEFNARFSGKPMHIVAPVRAILAIYARENGRGMTFDPSDEPSDLAPPPAPPPPVKKPSLRLVK